MRRFPIVRRVVWFNLHQDQIILAVKMLCHFHQRFPIDALIINAKAAPFRVVGEDLKEQLVDPGTSFARPRVAGDEPAATEIFARPGKAFQADDDFATAGTR